MAVRLQEEEDEGRQRIEEVGYLAIEPGYGTVNGRPIESGIQYDVDDTWQTVLFSGSYRRPVFLADVTSFHGANTAAVRYRNLTESSVEVRIEEERNQNGKTSHFEEAVGYLVVEGAATSGAGFGMGSYGTGMFGR